MVLLSLDPIESGISDDLTDPPFNELGELSSPVQLGSELQLFVNSTAKTVDNNTNRSLLLLWTRKGPGGLSTGLPCG